MALDVKIINFASYLSDQGMLYSTDIEHSQTLDRHKIICTVIIHPDHNQPRCRPAMFYDRTIRAMSDTTYIDSGVREATMDALKAGIPFPVDQVRSGGRISMNIANAIRTSVVSGHQM